MRTRPIAVLALLAAVAGPLALASPASAAEQRGAIAAVGPSPGAGSRGFDAPRTRRDEGLPVVLAAVLAAGVGSLHVRLLLAEPAARRAPARQGPGTVVTGG